MKENNLGASSFGFELLDLERKEEYLKVGLYELLYLIEGFIDNPGVYALKLQLFEIDKSDN